MNAFDVLKERGFVQQCSDESALQKILSSSGIVYYIGFDPTADSLHVGSLMPIMAMAHLQKAGNIPIAIIGGGTAMIGDPSGRTKMRQLLSVEEIETNGIKIREQLQRYLILDNKQGMFINNAEWLLDLNYIKFLRDIGQYFKVNEMIKAEGYRQRLEREEGLSFIEFNYQLLQAYDFLMLFERHGCILQMGGDDQWGNILAGLDLIRRIKSEKVYALTFPLITTARGQKMGKTESGAVWLDAGKVSPYEFYQYWINTDDRDVICFLAYFTFLPMAKIHELATFKYAKLRIAKEILAFEATKLAHGAEEAEKAQAASRTAFAKNGEELSALPTTIMERDRFVPGIPVVELFCEVGLASSKSDARRLIKQGGAYLNRDKISSSEILIKEEFLENNEILLRRGKKNYHRILVG
ncbi:MAG: tyrosine--tRNA ligase [bacterium]